MKVTPMIMSSPMIKALLSGSKTQTRRVMKPQPILHENANGSHWTWKNCAWTAQPPHCPIGTLEIPIDYCPYGKPGDILFVRETFLTGGLQGAESHNAHISEIRHFFRADFRNENDLKGLWVSPIFMPRGVSRLTLEIIEVRVERLHAISEEDAQAEGVDPLFTREQAKESPELDLTPMPYANYLWYGHVGKSITRSQSDAWPHQFSSYKDAHGSYSSLWEHLHGSGSWNANPWVWTLSFAVRQVNVDSFLKSRGIAA